MKKIIIVCLIAIGVGVWMWYSQPEDQNYGSARPAIKTDKNVSKCQARENGKLPDPNCTPGAVRTTDKADICSTKTSTLRPPTSYTNKLKVQQIKDYGYTDTDLSHYEEDHLISLTLGGDPKDPKNLWPEFGDSPNPKDKIENELHRDICSGKITVEYAQKCIAENWQTCYK